MKQKKAPPPASSEAQRALPEQVRVVLVTAPDERRRWQHLLKEHHCLGDLKPVGEQLDCATLMPRAAGWCCRSSVPPPNISSTAIRGSAGPVPQGDRRLSLMVNNSRFLILPDRFVPNLGSRVLRRSLDCLSAGWSSACSWNGAIISASLTSDPSPISKQP